MIDRKLRPWLLEVNHSPSFFTDSELDYDLKLALMTDTIRLLGLNPIRKSKYKRTRQKELNDRMMGKHKNAHSSASGKNDKRTAAEKKRHQYEEKNLGNFEALYPSAKEEDNMRYTRYGDEALKIWEKFTGSYKPPPAKAATATPKLTKIIKKGSTSAITITTKPSKKNSVRLSVGRPAKIKDNDGRIHVRKTKKMPSERIELESPDGNRSSYK
jgi:hypothetical protein